MAVYDNSAANPVNPDPAATVKYGKQTTDEMFNGYVDFAIPRSTPPKFVWAGLAISVLWLLHRRWKPQPTAS